MKTLTSANAFFDPVGNVLANGYLMFQLNQSANVPGGGELNPFPPTKITLDATGKVLGTPQIWCQDELRPTGTYYIVQIFNSNGLLVRGPENWLLPKLCTDSCPI